jgi:hypothetical protein
MEKKAVFNTIIINNAPLVPEYFNPIALQVNINTQQVIKVPKLCKMYFIRIPLLINSQIVYKQ